VQLELHGKSTSLSNQMLWFNWSGWSFLQLSSESWNSYPLVMVLWYKKVNFWELLLCKEVVIPAPDQILTVSSCRTNQMRFSSSSSAWAKSLHTSSEDSDTMHRTGTHLKCDKCCRHFKQSHFPAWFMNSERCLQWCYPIWLDTCYFSCMHNWGSAF